MKEGKWHPLSERLSRRARIHLLEILIDGMKLSEIAQACEVTVQAVSNWVNKRNVHPGNESSETLLELAIEEDRRAVEGIIERDVKRYREELREIGLKVSPV